MESHYMFRTLTMIDLWHRLSSLVQSSSFFTAPAAVPQEQDQSAN